MNFGFVPILCCLILGCAVSKDSVSSRDAKSGSRPARQASAMTAFPEKSASTQAKSKTPPFIHQPYARDECGKCHDMAQGGVIRLEIPQLCYQCHETEQAAFAAEEVHSPVEDGECLECHHAHESKLEHLLLKPVPEVCFGCHDEEDFEADPVHAPVEDVECIECHSPHASGNEFLLNEEQARARRLR